MGDADAILDFSRLTHDTAQFVGATLCDQYQLLEIIGEGGAGVVFRARQIAVDRDVAVKVLHRRLAGDERAVLRFENEARAISRLRHPNTLRLYDCQRTPDGDIFIVTELLAGKSLARLLFEDERVPLDRALRVIDHVCRSLSEAHAEGIVHRDLKPENVFLDRVGSEEMVKVLDFGIAKILEDDESVTRHGFAPGTPYYMSPEQAQGIGTDARSDIYSLGVMLYEMLSGAPPFVGETSAVICSKHVIEPPPRLTAPNLGPRGPRVEALIHRMLAKRPDQRPGSVEEVRAAIAELTSVRSSSSFLTVSVPPTEPPPPTTNSQVPAFAFSEVSERGPLIIASERPLMSWVFAVGLATLAMVVALAVMLDRGPAFEAQTTREVDRPVAALVDLEPAEALPSAQAELAPAEEEAEIDAAADAEATVEVTAEAKPEITEKRPTSSATPPPAAVRAPAKRRPPVAKPPRIKAVKARPSDGLLLEVDPDSPH